LIDHARGVPRLSLMKMKDISSLRRNGRAGGREA
jgi:hypothetical protein